MDKRPFRVIRWAKRSQRGQAIIEFAIGAPLLLIMLLGLVEFGHGLNSYLTIVASARDAARLGAQYGVTPSNQTAMQNVISKQTERLENSESVSVVMTSCEAPLGPGDCVDPANRPADRWVKVEVCYNHPTITHAPLIPDPIRMCSSTTIRIASKPPQAESIVDLSNEIPPLQNTRSDSKDVAV